MWELNKSGDWFKFDDGVLVASLIHHDAERDNHPRNRWVIQIHTVDDGLFVIGYVNDEDFDAVTAQAIADAALRENMTFEQWKEAEALNYNLLETL